MALLEVMVKAPFRGSSILPQKLVAFTDMYCNIQGLPDVSLYHSIYECFPPPFQATSLEIPPFSPSVTFSILAFMY